MADITNPTAVRFSNERIRPAADDLAQAYYRAKRLVNEWYAQNLGTLFPSGDTVIDGSAQDGRPVITGNDVTGIVVRASEIVADFEASNNAKLNTVLKVAVHAE